MGRYPKLMRESDSDQYFWRSRWLVTRGRTRDPVREQKADFVRTGQSGDQDGPDDRGHVVQHGSPGFAILPTCSHRHAKVNRNYCSKGSKMAIFGHRRSRTLNHTIHTPEKRCLKERKPEQSQNDLTLVDELWGRVRKYPTVIHAGSSYRVPDVSEKKLGKHKGE